MILTRIGAKLGGNPNNAKSTIQKVQAKATQWLLNLVVPTLILSAVVIGTQLMMLFPKDAFQSLAVSLFPI